MIKSLLVRLEHGAYYVDLNNASNWRSREDLEGSCYTWTIKPDLYNVAVRELAIQHAGKIDLFLYIGSPGTFQSTKRRELRIPLRRKYLENHAFLYDIFKMMDYKGQPCEKEQNYSKDECFDKLVFNQSMNQFNCTVPWLTNIDHICNQTYAKNASGFWGSLYGSDKILKKYCKHTCQYLQATSTTTMESKTNTLAMNRFTIKFRDAKKVFTAYYVYGWLSLIAEFGGYVGLFLGWSVYQVAEIPEQFQFFKS